MKSALIAVLSLALCLTPLGVSAGPVGTGAFLDGAPPSAQSVTERLRAARVQQALRTLGADPAMVEARVAQLSAEELAAVDQQLDRMPAGAGLVGLLGVIFVVLLVLELVGVINVFNRI